jgi:hypothetical protein
MFVKIGEQLNLVGGWEWEELGLIIKPLQYKIVTTRRKQHNFAIEKILRKYLENESGNKKPCQLLNFAQTQHESINHRRRSKDRSIPAEGIGRKCHRR